MSGKEHTRLGKKRRKKKYQPGQLSSIKTGKFPFRKTHEHSIMHSENDIESNKTQSDEKKLNKIKTQKIATINKWKY